MNSKSPSYPYSTKATSWLFLSLITHIIFLWIISSSEPYQSDRVVNKNKTSQLIPIKTIGISSGADTFSAKLPHPNTLKSKKRTPHKLPSLEQLKPLSKFDHLKSDLPTIKKNKQRGLSISQKNIVQLQKIKQLTIRELSPALQYDPILQKTGFFFKFVPPKGIPENELNSIEKIFYSFKKRTYKSYVSSLLSSYAQLITSKPYLKESLFTKKELLTGKIAIDRAGNITRIHFIKSSNNQDVQKLFERTLTKIERLPNPPKELLKGGEELDIYFQLIIAD